MKMVLGLKIKNKIIQITNKKNNRNWQQFPIKLKKTEKRKKENVQLF
jgi:hypothetical protein